MKKLLSLLICSVIVLGFAAAGGEGFMQAFDAFCVKANAAEYGKYGLLNYQVENGEVQITGADRECAGDIVIPEEIDGYPVTSIGNVAFAKYFRGITSVIIPDSVTSIGEGAFSGCTGLTSLIIPDSVTSIGSYAFNGVKNIIHSDKMKATGSPWGAKYVNAFADEIFLYSDSSKTVLLECHATNSESLVIPDSVTTICDEAFYECSKLTSVTIGSNVKTIGEQAFNQNLSKVNYTGTVSQWAGIDFSYCFSNPTYYTGDLYINNELLTEAIIEDGIEKINDYAFYNCSSLVNVTISESVTIIGNHAFSYCTSLTSITIPDSVTIIGESAFERCTSLTSVKMSKNITVIEDGLFFDCTNLKDITIPDGVTSIGSSVFCDCTALTSITIPDSVTTIGMSAFGECSAVEMIALGNNVKYIFDAAFAGCYKLTDIAIPDSVTYIGGSAFGGCFNLTSIKIPEGVTEIEEACFWHCYNLTDVSIPDSVTSIGDQAFAYCMSLSDIVIPDSVTSIGEAAFSVCPSLEYIHIPSGVDTIGEKIVCYNDIYMEYIDSIYYNEYNKILNIITDEQYQKFSSITPVNTYICSDSEDCYAKEYAEANGIEFKVCTGHEKHNWDNVKIETAPEQKADYRSKVIIKATAENVPEGYYLVMTVDGKEIRGTNTEVSYEIAEIKSDVTYSVKVVDEDGNVQKDSSGNELKKDGGKITCASGFFKRLIAFFKALFKILSMVEIKP